jgi:hypothetical protein
MGNQAMTPTPAASDEPKIEQRHRIFASRHHADAECSLTEASILAEMIECEAEGYVDPLALLFAQFERDHLATRPTSEALDPDWHYIDLCRVMKEAGRKNRDKAMAAAKYVANELRQALTRSRRASAGIYEHGKEVG